MWPFGSNRRRLGAVLANFNRKHPNRDSRYEHVQERVIAEAIHTSACRPIRVDLLSCRHLDGIWTYRRRNDE